MIETAEGPVSMRETPKKGFAVMTRTDDGRIGFRQLIKLEERADVPVVRIHLDNGHAVVAARRHVFFERGMKPVAAEALREGALLESAFQYPEGYVPHGLTDVPAAWGVRVARVEDAGSETVMTGTVRDTHRLFLTAGVLCGE